MLITTPLALAGSVAPTLWLLVARTAALLGLVVAFRLCERLAGRWAGVLCVAGLVLSTHWLREFAHGYTEPLAIGLLLAAVDRHIAGRHRTAFALGALVALTRPEAWLLLLAYAAFLMRRRLASPLFLGMIAAVVPALWLVPDWIGSGDPFHADKVSRLVEPTGVAAAFAALGDAALLLPFQMTLCALAFVAFARRDRAAAAIGAVGLGWTALLMAMMLDGYPASGRFFVLPSALVCVVGAVGAVRLAETVRGRRLAIAVAVTVLLASSPFVFMRGEATADEGIASITRAQLEDQLGATVHRDRAWLMSCGTPAVPNGMTWAKGEVAWGLDLQLRRVRGVATSAYAFVKRLGDPGDRPLARLPRGRAVSLRPSMRRFGLLAPYGDARVRLARGGRLHAAPGAGPWRTVCRRS